MRLLICILVSLVPLSAWAKEPLTAGMVYGEAASSCETFVEARRDEMQQYHYLAWLNGYLSAVNKYETRVPIYKGAFDIKAGQDPEGLMLWLENYCRAYPLDNFFQAVLKLQLELQK